MKTLVSKFTFIVFISLTTSGNVCANPDEWMEIRKQSLGKCGSNLGISVDMVGLNDNTSNLSILCKSRHDNWHIFQFTSSDDVELKRGSKLSGESVGYIYRDYFIGLADGRDGKKNHRGFFIFGAGHGDYEKTQRKTGEKISVTGLYVTLGGGSEYRFDNRLALSWSIGIAAGGVVTDRVLTGSVIYYFSE